MPNTFMKVSNMGKQAYNKRLDHNTRSESLNGKEMHNIVKSYDVVHAEYIAPIKRSRAVIGHEIAAYNRRLKNAKTDKTRDKLQIKLDELHNERDGVDYNRGNKSKNISYAELVFSITALEEHFKNVYYAEDLSQLIEQYVREKFPNAQIDKLSIHLDQGNPHCHVNVQYDRGHTMSQDLYSLTGVKHRQYEVLQRDFNKYVREHDIVKKFNIDVNPTSNENIEYERLNIYKARQQLELEKVQLEKDKQDLEIEKVSLESFHDETVKVFNERISIIEEEHNKVVNQYDTLISEIMNKINNTKLATLYKNLKKKIQKFKKELELTEKDFRLINNSKNVLSELKVGDTVNEMTIAYIRREQKSVQKIINENNVLKEFDVDEFMKTKEDLDKQILKNHNLEKDIETHSLNNNELKLKQQEFMNTLEEFCIVKNENDEYVQLSPEEYQKLKNDNEYVYAMSN